MSVTYFQYSAISGKLSYMKDTSGQFITVADDVIPKKEIHAILGVIESLKTEEEAKLEQLAKDYQDLLIENGNLIEESRNKEAESLAHEKELLDTVEKNLTDEKKKTVYNAFYPIYEEGLHVTPETRFVTRDGVVYQVREHTSFTVQSGSNPKEDDRLISLSHVTGAQDPSVGNNHLFEYDPKRTYKKGELCSLNGDVYVSNVEGNTKPPGEYPSAWTKQT